MAVLGVIPARAGSKRFPGKNRAYFRGKPLFEWTVIEALKAKLDQLTLTTDDPEILEMALHIKGLNVIPRPAHLATDEATSEDILRWCLHVFDFSNFSHVVLLQPTSPLRLAQDIDDCIAISIGSGLPVVSYCEGKKNGAVYVAPSDWLQDHDFTAPHVAYLMPKERSLDIDYPKDIDDFLSDHRSP